MVEAELKSQRLEEKYNRHIKQTLEKIVNPKNRTILKKWHQYLIRERKKSPTIRSYLKKIVAFSNSFNKEFKNITKNDVESYLNQKVSLSPNSQNTIRRILRVFYRWLYGLKKGHYPTQVDWIECIDVKPPDVKKQIFNQDEIIAILRGEDRPVLRALWAVLFDCGCRPHEIYDLQIRDLKFDAFGIRFQVENYTKTGARPIRLIKSAPYLKFWLNEHPEKDNPNAYVFCGRKGLPFLPHTMNKYFKNIQKKLKIRVRNLYVTRKQVYCRLANMPNMNEIQAKKYMGHGPDSRSIVNYIFVDEEEIDRILIKEAGIEVGDIKRPQIAGLPTPKVCPLCRTSVKQNARFCPACEFDFEDSESFNIIEKLQEELKKKDEELIIYQKRVESLETEMINVQEILKKIDKKLS